MTSTKPNTEAYEREILVAPQGFREYDARWLFPEQINLRGLQALGMGIGTIIHEQKKNPPAVIVGHDYRSYSATVKQALIVGLMASGCKVYDIGLALSPTAYFSQFELDCPAVAMVTASHNENGWTGVKMGTERPMTFGPELMSHLKDIVTGEKYVKREGGSYEYVDVKERYIADLAKDGKIKRKLKAVVACGNGTASAYGPEALRRIGVDVIEMDCNLDYTFPKYNPNPEDMEMLHAMAAKVKETGADIAFGFDGDGDRCGVIDNTGEEIFADKIGVICARDLAAIHKGATFVADVKSTGLYSSDPVLKELGAKTDYWKTGHSYMKRRVNEIGALAGFEKSGHFFLNQPIGRGYDDGILTAVTICRILDRNADKSMSDLKDALPKTWGSPTMAPFCPDDTKYTRVEEVTKIYEDKKAKGEAVAGQKIVDLVTVNGVRFTLEDGSWGLIRASSNKPSLVVVVESPVSESRMFDVFEEIDTTLSTFSDVGEYDQKIARKKAA